MTERLRAVETEIARWQLRPGQLVIVDEASLAGTFALDELVSAAAGAGAKVGTVHRWLQRACHGGWLTSAEELDAGTAVGCGGA